MQFYLDNGKVYRSWDDLPGKKMVKGPANKTDLSGKASCYIVEINGSYTLNILFGSEEEANAWITTNGVQNAQVKPVEICRGPDILPLYGKFYVEGTVSFEEGITTYHNVVLAQAVQDVPKGTRLEAVQVVGKKLLYFSAGWIICAEETVSFA